jgi:CheY-like chemotaxis protein
VLVADADDAFLKHLARLLLQGGFTVYLAHDGAVAMELIKGKSPQVAIVDVALPKIYGFEVAEMVKQDAALLANTKVVLLGSVYEKDRYRRQPRSYYGADEYLEKHKDGPVIMAKVRKLILGEPEPEPAPAPAAPAPAAARPAPVPAPKPSAPAPAPAAPAPPVAVAPAAPPVLDDPAHQKAARLGRTIISDILLYNPDQVVRGIKEGNIHELLAKDIEDGLKHFNSRVSEDIRSKRDYFKEAFEAMIAKKKAELGIKDR